MLAILLVLVSFTSGWPSNYDAYKVSHIYDVVYYGFNRFFLVLGAMIVLFNSFLGHYGTLVSTFNNDYARGLGRMSYAMGLVTPIVMTMFYCSQENSIYLSNPSSSMWAMGHMVSNILTGFFVFVFIEYQL